MTNMLACGKLASRLSLLSNMLRTSAIALVAIGAVYFVAPTGAQSQINGRVTGAPSTNTPHTDYTSNSPDFVKPKAPEQVALPPAPPMRIFPGLEEPLVATGPVAEQENNDLDAALEAFHDAPKKAGAGADFDDYSKPLFAFIDAHPNSNWNGALYADIGFGYYHAGYFSRTFTYLNKSWALGRNATSVYAHRLFDKVIGELAKMHARVGHAEELDAVFKDIGNRPMGGIGLQMVQGAREGRTNFRHNPGISYLCGPQALKNVLTVLKAKSKQIKIANDAQSGPRGYSLTQLAALADKTGLKYKLIHRAPGQPIPVPSIINWNVHHYAAIISQGNGQYVINDPTFGDGEIVVTTKAIDAESSGYFLVPDPVAKKYKSNGWHTVAAKSKEANAVYGMGDVATCSAGQNKSNNTTTNNSCPDCGQNPSKQIFNKNGPPAGPPMAIASATEVSVSERLDDTPIGYQPQVGLTPQFTTVSYNQREDEQPAIFTFSNLSPGWSHSWMTYIEDNPTAPPSAITRVTGGGGGNNYIPYYPSGCFYPEAPDHTGVCTIPYVSNNANIQYYVRNFQNGSEEYYKLSNGATSGTRLWFLTSIVDARGQTTTLNYDAQFRITSVVDPMGRSTTFTYGLTGSPAAELLITQITDGFGRFTQLNYDASLQLSSITDPIGITSTFTYSPTETTFITNLATPYGNTVSSDTINPYDASFSDYWRSLTMTDPLGYTDYLYFYQNTGLVTSPGPVPSCVPGAMNAYSYYRNTFYWDRHQYAQIFPSGINSATTEAQVDNSNILHWVHATYDHQAYDALESMKKPLENRIWFFYFYGGGNNQGQYDRTQVQGRILDNGDCAAEGASYTGGDIYPNYFADEIGRKTQFTYLDDSGSFPNELNQIQQQTGPSSYTTIATLSNYNTQHEPQTYVGADGQTWSYTYNSLGQLATVTDPNSAVTTFNYDTTNRLSTVQDANNVTVLTLTYDSADRIHIRKDSQGYKLTYAYDNIDRITSITYPDGTTDLYDYTFQTGPLAGTPSLELRKHTDRLSRVTTYGYDADRRLTSVTEPVTATTTRTTNYDYYEDGALKDIIDANGNDTHWDIDIQSRPIDKIYAYGTSQAQTETYAYENTTSRLHSITDALGQVKTFTYADDDRVTNIAYTNAINTTPNVTFTWDPYYPRLNTMADGLGTTTYSYTPVGSLGGLKLSSIQGPFSGTTNDIIGLTYDALGRLAGATVPGGNESYSYDAISRLHKHNTPLGNFTYGYLGQTAQEVSRSVTNGSVTVSTGWGYDTNTNDRRLISIVNSGVTRSYALGYTSGGVTNPYDILSLTDTAAAGHPFASQPHAYGYDEIDRLLTATATTPGNDTYGYDNVDNATTVTTPSLSVNPTYNHLNEMKTFGTSNYGYDANGNTTSAGGLHSYKWDAENRLVEIDYALSGNKSTFAYDGLGHRTVETETSAGTTTTSHYLWCPDAATLTAAGLSGASAYSATFWDYQPKGVLPDGISQATGGTLCQTRDGSDNVTRRDFDEGEYNVTTGQQLIYMPDQLGSTRDVLDGTTGTLIDAFDYSPYGAITQSYGSTPLDFRYAGLMYHPMSGLNLATYRQTDPVTGRWLNKDPIREFGGLNLYMYTKANPVNNMDASGLDINNVATGGSSIPLTNVPQQTPIPQTSTGNSQCSGTTGNNGSGSKVTQLDCEEEREYARSYCLGLFALPASQRPLGIWGGSYSTCVMGQISQACGGNRVI